MKNPFARMTPRLFGVGPVLPVHDIEAAAKFYCDRLGFVLDFVMDGHGSVVRCSVGIQFTQAPDNFDARAFPGWTYIFTENIDSLYAEYLSKSVAITSELGDKAHGMREFEIEDPHGFKLRFGQYLKSR